MEQREDNKNDIASRRLKNLFGEALGDLSSVEETETAWQAFASRRRQERVRTLVFGFVAVASVTLLLFWGFSQENFLSQEVEVFASVNSPDRIKGSLQSERHPLPLLLFICLTVLKYC